MVRKKLSGQMIAIIILAILLLLAITFGGVYAFYSARANKVSGKVIMANLKIGMTSQVTGDDGTVSDKSEIVISNKENVVPGQLLGNTPLLITNESSVNVYLAVVYEVRAEKIKTEEIVQDKFEASAISFGANYINPLNESKNRYNGVNGDWIDFVFRSDASGEVKTYRCIVSAKSYAPTAEGETITVIGDDKLSLSKDMGSEYMDTNISLVFQAYAISADSFAGEITSSTTAKDRCQTIVSRIYQEYGYKFLNIN